MSLKEIEIVISGAGGDKRNASEMSNSDYSQFHNKIECTR